MCIMNLQDKTLTAVYQMTNHIFINHASHLQACSYLPYFSVNRPFDI